MTETPELATAQKVVSRSKLYYRVLQPLGRGGNSHVYLVEAMGGPHRGILFALKLFIQITKETRLGRFVEEVAFLKMCQHPAIMRVYDDGELLIPDDDKVTKFPFVIADYLPLTLYDAMRRGLNMVDRLTFALQLLSAAYFMSEHERCVVHRDIKPENIFVRGKSCILGDFGLIKFLKEPHASGTDPMVAGENSDEDRNVLIESTGPRLPRFYRTPDLVAYCRGKGALTAKSDVFQLGLVLCEMFTGRNPLQPCKNIYDDLVLDTISDVPGSQAAAIKSNLESMLIIDAESGHLQRNYLIDGKGYFSK